MAVGCDQTVLCNIVQNQLAHLGEPNIDKFHLLHLIDDYQLFSYEKSLALDKVFKEIHTLLESPKHRWFGLLLLQRAACQCNNDIQSDHAKYWLEKTLSFLKPHQPLEVRMMSFHTFCMLLRHISDKKNLSKYFDTPFLNSFIHMCLSNITCCPNQSIQSLTYCVEKFPQSADLFKHQVGEDWINKLFLQNIPAKHIAQLVSIVEHRSSVKSEFTNIEWHVTNIHHLLNLIVEEGDSDFQPLVLDNAMTTMLTNFSKTISEFEEPKRTTALIYKIRFGMACIDNLINKPAVKSSDTFRFNILGILQLFHRFIDIGSKKSMQSLRKELYTSYQPVLIQQATSLLACLIKHIRSLLAPFTLIVNDLFTKFLNKAVGTKSDTTILVYRNTKAEIYSCLAFYLQVLKSAVDRQGFTTFLISHILRDINIEESTMKLLNTNKKGRPNPLKSQNTTEGDLAVKALTALRWIILTTGPRINAKFLNDIQVSLLQCIETSLLQQFPHQMTGKRRKEQYHCLVALGTVRHAYYSPPIAAIMSLLNRASQEDTDLEVSSYCQEAMSSFEFIAIACRSVMFQTVSTQPQSETVKISSSRPSMWMMENLPESEPRQASFNSFPLQTEFGGTQQKQTNVSSESLAYLPTLSLSQSNTDSFKKTISFDEGASSSQASTSMPQMAAPSEVIHMDPISARGDAMDDVVSEPPSESNSAEPIHSDSDIQYVECGEDSAEEENSAEEASEETNEASYIPFN
uniref:Pre-rRNA-processing protein RIX1 N-terminal domain-containing protein n=1 Tax=Octopus bimaculoides TaxID=37653 RepID=A0A0L8GRF7_OCTBM